MEVNQLKLIIIHILPCLNQCLFCSSIQKKAQWKAEHESQIHRNFHMKASHRLSEMFRDARIAGECPYWMGEIIWNSLLAHWNSVEFCKKNATNQRNRASEKGGALHTDGSITIHEHAIRMVNFVYFFVSFIYNLCIFLFHIHL